MLILFIIVGTEQKMLFLLNLALALKQRFNKYIYMGKVKQIELKNRTEYFYNEMINLKDFDSNLLKIDNKHYKSIDIYYIGYITFKKMIVKIFTV